MIRRRHAMSVAPAPTPLSPGQIRFFDNGIPALEVGDYLINVAQHINPNTSPSISEWHVSSQLFSVQGPRYSLPTDDIFSTFPADQTQGVFDQSLPHIVFTRRELPWERDIFSDAEVTQTPWLALLLFVDNETIDGQPTLLEPQVDNWVKNRTYTAGLPAASFQADHSKDTTVRWPNLSSEWYETTDFLTNTPCTFIDISPTAFNKLIPSKADLRYLAHVRQVDASAKDSQVLKISGDGWYSVLVGNRLPDPPATGKPGIRNIVHLVSLEGFQDCFDTNGNPQAPAGFSRVRMISLQSWSFQCLPELGESFAELMDNLITVQNNSTSPVTYDTCDLSFILPTPPLPLDPTPEDTYAWNAIQNGYTPVSYQTRLGEQTFAWYRGPFSPIPVANFISTTQQIPDDPDGWQPFDTASSAMIYDKSHGLFDISYAVAWEAGRLLALADGHFGQQLLDWQRKGHRLIDLLLERKSQMSILKSFDPEDPDRTIETGILEGIKNYAITDDFMKYFITQFSTRIAPAIAGPQVPTADPGFPAFANEPSPVPNPQTIADLLTQADIQDAIRNIGGQELDTIADWLAERYLLMSVPFDNLVPHANLLPAESVRFFYLDSNWMDTLVEGALSIGIESSRDRLYQDLMKDLIWNTTFAAVQATRDNLLGAEASTIPAGGTTPLDQESLTGMLLRSAVVSGFPGLEVNAYAASKPGSSLPDLDTFIPLLRSEKLSPGLLLCLWPTVPAVVCIEEPHEGVAFGFEDPPEGQAEGDFLYLRSLDTSSYGEPLCDGSGPCAHQINAQDVIQPTRVLNLSGNNGLLSQMSQLLPNQPAISVRDFALQMIKVPEQAVIAVPAATKATEVSA